MSRQFDGLFAGLLLIGLALPAGPAAAQYYPPPPPVYRDYPPPVYRGAPPAPYVREDRIPPGYFLNDDHDDEPVTRRPPAQQRVQPGQPRGILPDDVDVTPPPGRAYPGQQAAPPPAYGHQLNSPNRPDLNQQRPDLNQQQDVMRPSAPLAPRAAPQQAAPQAAPSGATAALPPEDQPEVGEPKELPPELKRQMVNYSTKEPVGTVIVDTAHTYLYFVLGGGKAIRYGIGVGREGFTWEGRERISKMTEWPDWHPPTEMIERQPYLPRFMAGGDGNPLGARALYLGKTLYRIHGTNQPSTIGKTVSSGCIRLLNSDIEDLYSRVQVGTRIVVLPGRPGTEASAANPAPAGPPAGAPPTNIAPQGSDRGITSRPLPPVR